MYGDVVANPSVQYPEVVSIWEDLLEDADPRYFDFSCTGTLIEPQVVLTAAHCVQGVDSPLYVEYGGSQLGSGTFVPVVSDWYNPRYSKSRIANDVGVLYLGAPVPGVRPAKLMKSSRISSKTKLELVGWGNDQNGDNNGRLHSLGVKIDVPRARSVFGSEFNPRTTLAAGRYFKADRVYGGACNGDSGGPLFLSGSREPRRIVGIVSYGIRGCDANAPTVFARSDFYWRSIQTGIQEVKTEWSSQKSKATPSQGQVIAAPTGGTGSSGSSGSSPTISPTPTATPTQTTTVTPTTAVPWNKVTYSGSGSTVLDIQTPSGVPGVVKLTHTGRRNFIVWGLDSSFAKKDLLGNEIGTYSGTKFLTTSAITKLEITADGSWTVEVDTASSSREVVSSTTGRGDEVLRFGGPVGAYRFTHDGSSNFVVWLYSSNGRMVDLLVNEIGSYDGTVVVPAGAYMSVESDGNWSIARF